MKVSFCIPSYNSAAWLSQAVQSCLEQTHKDIEVIVVDDGSTDSTPDYMVWQIKEDKRVVYLRNEKNLGRSASRNIGNAKATGEVIAVLDADDLALPNRAKITSERFGKGCEFLYGSAVRIDPCGRYLNEQGYICGPNEMVRAEIRADVFNKEKALERMENRIVHSTVAYTPSFAKRFPYRDGEANRLGTDDWSQQIEAAISGVKLDFVPNVLSAYRILDSGVSQNRKAEEVAAYKKAFLEGLTAKV